MKRRLSESDGDGDGAPPTSHNDSDDTSIDSPARQRDNVQETTAIEGPSKVQRVAPDSLALASPGAPRPSISCSLPPTCSIHPQSFPTHAALSAHYNSHHAHVCQVPSCGKIFPDNHFLDLHLREFHDPLVAVQRENGKKTYACFAVTCNRKFSTPTKRKRHLIEGHKYPQEFFFALPLHGLEQLYARFGDSASLVRPARSEGTVTARTGSTSREATAETEAKCSQRPSEKHRSSSSHSPLAPNPLLSPDPANTSTAHSTAGGSSEHSESTQLTAAKSTSNTGIDTLTSSMSKLAFVPSSLRFGQGKGSRFTTRPRPKAATQDNARPASQLSEAARN